MIELLLISGLGLIMGIVNSISGGAGVFAVPTMLAFGIPPVATLALNRTSDLGVVLGALRGYHKSKSIDWKLAFRIMIPLVIGSFTGASIIVKLPEKWLPPIILAGVVIGIIFLLKKPTLRQLSHNVFHSRVGLLFIFLVGIWSGALAMAGATFAVLVLVHFFGKNFLEARATEIVAAIPATAISVIILFLNSESSFSWLLVMFVSNFVGAWIGSHLAAKRGSDFIRKAMIGIAFIMIVKVVLSF